MGHTTVYEWAWFMIIIYPVCCNFVKLYLNLLMQYCAVTLIPDQFMSECILILKWVCQHGRRINVVSSIQLVKLSFSQVMSFLLPYNLTCLSLNIFFVHLVFLVLGALFGNSNYKIWLITRLDWMSVASSYSIC